MQRFLRVHDNFPYTVDFSKIKTIETDTCIMTINNDKENKLGECVVDVEFKNNKYGDTSETKCSFLKTVFGKFRKIL